jgi:LPXTG-site transpeptidase (sortase) family protein
MNRRTIGSVLLIIGALIFTFAIVQYYDIRVAQREMLVVQEVKTLEVENPIVLPESSIQEKMPTAGIQLISEEKAAALREDYQSGQMTIAIPKLEINAAVVKGTSVELLKKGPGLYESSPMPNLSNGNVCIAGHRTTYGAWFRNVDQLEEGDEIILDYNSVKYTYQVQRVFIVDKKDWTVIESQDYPAITLTSCHPLRSSKQRIVVRGKLIE